ncbi:MAG: glycosyltransferase family 2 protein [Gemmatimonadaceae bacterium]|nr:glycosyltransferase family 2 protein [Gemmatimonadaceae bacterium]
MWLAVAVLEWVALVALLRRLGPARHRPAPDQPRAHQAGEPTATVLVASLDEVARIGPLLDGLRAQDGAMARALCIDSNSTDGTRALIARAAEHDARLELHTDPPLADGWIGKAWALQHGAMLADTEWVIGLDADTEPAPGLVGALLARAVDDRLDFASYGPRFVQTSAAERWVQPALLTTLIYRTGGGATPNTDPEHVLANGQCWIARRSVLLAHGGFEPVRASFAEDVSLARHLARRGARVAFLDGAALYRVRAYTGFQQMWREWGRSIDLKDARTPIGQLGDLALLIGAQAAPWLIAPLALRAGVVAALAPAVILLGFRPMILTAARGSYEQRGLPFWLSPLADLLAVGRVLWSSVRRPARWRSRGYPEKSR